jgi:hypothetical protein
VTCVILGSIGCSGLPKFSELADVLEPKALFDNIGIMSGFVPVPSTSEYSFRMSLPDDDAMLYLSSRSIDAFEFRIKLECREWESVILSSSAPHLHLMIIKWDGNNVAARVGVLFIHSKYINSRRWWSDRDPCRDYHPYQCKELRLR